jgi:hypothetical protein
MTRNARFLAFLALTLSCVFPAWAQYVSEGARGSIVGTVADVDEARSQIAVDPDQNGSRITVLSDSVSTQYNGFGGVINGQPEIFTGSQGLSNVRTGDRIEVRGVGQANYSIRADVVTLLGRPTPAPQTGVGTTRSPTSVSTPTATTTAQSARVSPLEGTIQDVNANDGRLVIVTDRREVMTVRVSSATPVSYKGVAYRISNLEVGDRIRVNPDPSSSATAGDEMRASSIEVTRSVQEGTNVPKTNTVSGRVASTDRSLDMVTIDTGRQSIRVDVATASDSTGRRVRAADFRQGDRIEVNGRYSGTATDLFVANVVRWVDESAAPAPSGTTEDVTAPPPATQEFAAVTIYGTVTDTLANSPQLVVRDNSNRTIRLNVLEDFVVKGRTGYTTAVRLKAGDNVVIKAYRDLDGNYIAQTIRLR